MKGLLLRGLILPAALAALWRLQLPAGMSGWPLGLDALFRTDLPAALAGLALARLLANGRDASPRLVRLERLACLAFLPAAALPFTPWPGRVLADVAAGLFTAIIAMWSGLSLAATIRALREETRPALRASAALFLCFAGVFFAAGRYTCHVAAPTGDEPHYLMVAHSLWQDRDLDVADDFAAGEHVAFYPAPFGPRPWDIHLPDGRIYSWGGAAFPALLALPYGLGGRSGAVLLVNLLTALGLVCVYRLSRDLGGSVDRCLAASVGAGFSLPVLAYSSVLYPETAASVLLLLALLAAGRAEAGGSVRPWTHGLAFGLLVALAVLRAKYLALALPAAIGLATGPRGRRSARMLGAFAALVAAYLVLDRLMLNGEYTGRVISYLTQAPREVVSEGRVARLLGLWLDQEGGILLYNPLILAGVLALWPLARTKRPVGVAVALSAGVYALAASAAYEAWYGEWWYPGRFLVPVALLGAIAWAAGPEPAGPESSRKSAWRPFLVFGALQAAVMGFALILSPRLGYNYADGTASVLDALEALMRRPVCRFFPSLIRPTEWTQWLSALLMVAAAGLLRLRHGRLRTLGRSPSLRSDAALGLLVFAAFWALPVAAGRLCPTRVIEVEDTLVRGRGARPWPESRPYHQRLALGDVRLGLRLPPRASLAADLVSPGGVIHLFISAASQDADGVLRVWIGREVRAVLGLPAGNWGPFGVYTLDRRGLKELKLRNDGGTDILVDRIEVVHP